ncbi:MAG TPA: zinc ABC transporter substrate-binding protein [Hyphomicrobiales bacterium]|nr:zinc ABC transporter substrate-binding protein [Hyphomicrobiales bacterium]
MMSFFSASARRSLSLFCCLLFAGGMVSTPAMAAERLQVVATFSILGDFTAVIGGEFIELHTLVGYDSDGHLYQPTPQDSRLLRHADLIVSNGLGFEGWMERLIRAAEYEGDVVVASHGIVPLFVDEEGERHADPHAWQDIGNARQYLSNIRQALQRLLPQQSGYFAAREAHYLQALAALEQELIQKLGALPPAARTVVTNHDAFGYFAQAYGVRFLSPVGLNTDSEASARDVARLIRQIRDEGVRAVFIENITDPRLLQRITQESGAVIGGVLYSDALSQADGPAHTYLAMMRHNLHTLLAALAPDA